MEPTRTEQVLELVRQAGMLRPRDLKPYGYSREYLRRLEQRGLLRRSARGVYMLADADLTESHDLAEACKRVPHGVICLLSALQFHMLTTQWPFEVWMAIDPKAHLPKVGYPHLRIFRFSGEAFTHGIEEHWIEGVRVRVYSPAKTVADCFKYRSKVGWDVMMEALQDGWQKHRYTMDALWKAAEVCRITEVMRPYAEMMVA